ncbi:MAG: type II secretion system protein [Candidatus Saccharimonadales bacterium]
MKCGQKQKAFTIVELLIVIVVIGILAAISLIAYSNVQAKARDSERISDLAALKKAIMLYHTDKGDYVEANCGAGGTGSGWLNSDYDGAGPYLPINTCLLDSGHLKREIFDPSGNRSCSGLGCRAYMKASCPSGVTYLFANLETRPQASTDADETCYASWDTSYGMNYVLRVN